MARILSLRCRYCRISKRAKRLSRVMIPLVLGCLFLIIVGLTLQRNDGNVWIASFHQDVQAKFFLDKYVNRMVSIYPIEVRTLVGNLLHDHVISTYPLNITQNVMLISNETAFIPLLRKMREEAIQQLSLNTAEGYPISVNMREMADRVLSNRSVPYQPINNFVHPFRVNPLDICNASSVYLLVLVKSAVQNYRLRQMVRNTWLKDIYNMFKESRVLFVLGESDTERFMMADELLLHKDILQGKFKDTYRNNTLKTMMTFHWITEHCRNARFVLYADDDVFINAKLVKKYLDTVTADMERDLYSGIPAVGNFPIRVQSKWLVSKKEYPFLIYPIYLSGCAMFFSQNTVQRFRSIFPYVAYLPFDDVYLGIVAGKLGIRPQRNNFMFNDKGGNISTAVHHMIATHGFHKPEFLYRTHVKSLVKQ